MTTITVTFDPPLPSDSPATFNSKAFDTLGDLNTWSGQANTVAGEVNTNATNAATSAGTASTHASTATTKAGEANASAVAAAASASSASTSAGTATTKASEADASAIAAAASAASIAPGSLLTTANPSYTGTLTGGTGVVNLGSGQLVKDTSGNLGLGVTRSAGGDAYYRRIELGKAGCGIAAATNSLTSSELSYFTGNAVITYTGANPWKYGNDGAAGYYAIEDGQHKWGVAPGGTAGNPISFTQAMTLDTAGNLGLGVTPSAWKSTYRAIEIGAQGNGLASQTAGSPFEMVQNCYVASDNSYRYVRSAPATNLYQNNGGYVWYTAPSGTAGNQISFTQAMTLDASGNLGLGVPAPSAKLDVASDEATTALRVTTASNRNYQLRIGYRSASLSGEIQAIHVGTAYSDLMLQRDGGNVLVGASGNLLVGTAVALGGERLNVTGNVANNISRIYNTNASPYGLYMAYTQNVSGTSNEFLDFRTNGSTQKFVVYSDGNTRIAAGSTYGNLSDRKLKDNITDASPKLADVMRLKVRNFTVKDDPSQIKFIGWIAQEFEEVFPGLVSKTEDTEEVKKAREIEVSAVDAVLDDEGNEVTPAVEATTRTEEYTERVPTGTFTKGIKESALIPILTKALQEQQAQIEAMQAQLDDQNTAMQLLASRLAALEAAA